MSFASWSRQGTIGASLIFLAFTATLTTIGQEPQRSREPLREPVYRVSKARVEPPADRPIVHPLDPALQLARDALGELRNEIKDYSCTLIKRERIKGVVNDPEYIYAEIRNREVRDGRITTPFGVYMYFLKPSNIKGREVIFVEGENNNKMVAHEGGGLLKLAPSVWLRPEGPIAMRNQLYPITEVGIENLIVKLIERGERDRQVGPPEETEVQFIKNAKINGRVCTVLQVMHPVRRPYFDFYLARIFIDDELNVPIRYAAYDWPANEGGKPQVIEEYTYLNLKVNVGLDNSDFDHKQKFRG